MKRFRITRTLLGTGNSIGASILFGLLVAILLIGADQLSAWLGLNEPQRVVDDVLGGAIAGCLVWAYLRTRIRHTADHLNTVALMNHHIRNALEVIQYAGYIQRESNQTKEIENAVQRIDWALREILPGRVKTYDQEWKPDSQKLKGNDKDRKAS